MDEFNSTRDLLAWAYEDTQDLKAKAIDFLDHNAYVQIREIDPDTGNIIFKVRMTPVPDELRKLASHAVWDLKHALDHAMAAAVSVVTSTPAGDVHFPICSHPNDLTQRLKSDKFPPALHPIIWRFEPYPSGKGYSGGSDEICAFSKMANASKHTVALATNPRTHLTHFKGTGGMVKVFQDAWDSATHELTIGHFRPGTDAKMDLEFASHIAFSEVPAFEGYLATDVLDAIGRSFEAVVDELEAEAAWLAGRMG